MPWFNPQRPIFICIILSEDKVSNRKRKLRVILGQAKHLIESKRGSLVGFSFPAISVIAYLPKIFEVSYPENDKQWAEYSNEH